MGVGWELVVDLGDLKDKKSNIEGLKVKVLSSKGHVWQ